MQGNRLTAHLFDGRELFYFDDFESSLPAERKRDSRPSDTRPQTADLRFDPLSSEFIAVASHRQTRAFLPPAHSCPLCPTTEDNLSELPDVFDVAVFENKGPAFGPDSGFISPAGLDVFGHSTLAFGRCEVVVFSPEHEGSLGSMPVSRIRTVISAWMDRTRELYEIPGVVQVFPFENRGEEIGVTLHHPHGQIYSYPFVTPRTQRLQEAIANFGPGFFEELFRFESGGPRVVLESEHFLAFVPFAARWPIEIHALPKRHIQDLSQLTDAEADDLAIFYKKLLQGVDSLYSTPTPYISAWHQAPAVANREDFRLMLQITSPRRAEDKLKFLAGSEAAMGAWVGDVTPESQAERLREVLR
ncbi:galactose-1-phosphate uridylyltransferase [Aquiluna borgnonia]|uniref:Galactose-1-phosphate uridylyltransferase n=2 Tax=Aquiluna borgnonia TaxID=2499157 RepID=A0A7D4TSB5_9MICO|nr:galactose-1-phosphate uridylyltransferase [Aquiluna borgnonia]